MVRLLVLLLLAITANATSVHPTLHECPICGVKSVTMSLASFSQFGEPARDLADSPQFQFANVEVCPNDLYASWNDVWKAVDAEEKAKLTTFLKLPFLQLTDAELTAIGSHQKAFRDSNWFQPLWARTCDRFRIIDDRRELRSILRLHFAGKFPSQDRPAEEWQMQLGSLFRENAITALKEATTAKWPKSTEKRVFAYLRAELTRQAGRNDEALSLFKEVIASEITAEPENELAWIPRWASEQSLLCDPKAKATDKPPSSADNDDEDRKLWRKEVLWPLVRKSAAEGGIPEPDFPTDESFSGLPLLIDGPPAKPSAKPSFIELNRELYQLWKEHPSARQDIARIYIRNLRQTAENWESTQYPAMYLLPAIAETEENRGVIRTELDGSWKSSFWKTACAYAARLPDSGDAFTHHPFTAKADNALIFKMLTQRSDASWKLEAINKLNHDDWISSDLIDYLVLLDLPETKSALATFTEQVRNQAGDPKRNGMLNGKLSALQQIDDSSVNARFQVLSIRNKDQN